MPAMVFAGRRFIIGTDDLAIPAVIVGLLHLAWYDGRGTRAARPGTGADGAHMTKRRRAADGMDRVAVYGAVLGIFHGDFECSDGAVYRIFVASNLAVFATLAVVDGVVAYYSMQGTGESITLRGGAVVRRAASAAVLTRLSKRLAPMLSARHHPGRAQAAAGRGVALRVLHPANHRSAAYRRRHCSLHTAGRRKRPRPCHCVVTLPLTAVRLRRRRSPPRPSTARAQESTCPTTFPAMATTVQVITYMNLGVLVAMLVGLLCVCDPMASIAPPDQDDPVEFGRWKRANSSRYRRRNSDAADLRALHERMDAPSRSRCPPYESLSAGVCERAQLP